MLSLEAAQKQILSRVPTAVPERISVLQCYRRVAAESVVAPVALPGFDNSAMDGYAVRAADAASASDEHPVPLRLSGRSIAGAEAGVDLESGNCIRVFTGAPLPAGSDAVVMQEDTRVDDKDEQRVWIRDAVKRWENVRFRGEDVKLGSVVLSAGERISAARLGLLAALGIDSVSVGRQPKVALMATGSELVEAGSKLGGGQIYESNRAMLAPLLERAGASVQILPLVPDQLGATRQALMKAFAECDAVVTSGGVSVGELDFVKDAFEQLGGRLEFWRVAIKPGKPFVFGELGEKKLFGLPGNPVSALVTFILLVRPALLRWQGATDVTLAQRLVTVSDAFQNRGDRRHFMRAQLDNCGRAKLAGAQASHFLGSLAAAHGLIDVPPETVLPPGAQASFITFED